MSQSIWTMDLSAPLTKEEKRALRQRPKKDHKCPHDRRHPTGMELCEKCGDFGVCATCGIDYIKRDMGGLPVCHLCWSVKLLADQLDRARSEQRKRIERYRPVTVGQEVGDASQARNPD